jgi:hypothetical protein
MFCLLKRGREGEREREREREIDDVFGKRYACTQK